MSSGGVAHRAGDGGCPARDRGRLRIWHRGEEDRGEEARRLQSGEEPWVPVIRRRAASARDHDQTLGPVHARPPDGLAVVVTSPAGQNPASSYLADVRTNARMRALSLAVWAPNRWSGLSERPTVVCRVRQRLTLLRPTRVVTRQAVYAHLARVPAEGPPSPDLPIVLTWQPATHPASAVPLEPAARVLRMNYPRRRHPESRRPALTLEQLQVPWRAARGRAWRPVPGVRNSSRQSVRYLPPNTPRRSMSRGVSSGLKRESKPTPCGSRSTYS